MTPNGGSTSRSVLQRALDAVERVGNVVPHPASLFVVLSAVVIFLSWALHTMGTSVSHPMTGAAVTPVNLLSIDGLQRMVLNIGPNFVNFAPVGPVIVSLLGLSVAEQSALDDGDGGVCRCDVAHRWRCGLCPAIAALGGALSHVGPQPDRGTRGGVHGRVGRLCRQPVAVANGRDLGGPYSRGGANCQQRIRRVADGELLLPCGISGAGDDDGHLDHDASGRTASWHL